MCNNIDILAEDNLIYKDEEMAMNIYIYIYIYINENTILLQIRGVLDDI